MLHKLDIFKIITLLKKNTLVSKVEILMVDEIEKRGFYFDVPAEHEDNIS